MALTGHYQNGYVTRDLDRAVDLFSRRFGAIRFGYFEAEVPVLTADGPATMALRLAAGWAGHINIEIVQPISGAVDHYRTLLPADTGMRLHHVALRSDDLSAMEAEIAALGHPLAFGGDSEAMVFRYVDARDTLGHYLEYVWKAPGGWDAIGWPAGRPAL
jgi:catechol 2,3-dioxygenase-like lactoylglutathione lyase family enzyme